MALNAYQNRESPSWRVLEYLQRKGAATIKELEDVLGVTTTAVRQQLQTLQADGYVERSSVHAGVGRPHHVYSLTAKAHELFSSHCDDLALTLLEEVFALEGEERTGQLLERVGSRLAKRYSPLVRSGRLKERVAQLAEALYARGVLTDVSQEAEDVFILQTYNCPYHELAHEHRDICEMDEKFMREVLGSDVNLHRCMMDGHPSCKFVVHRNLQGKS